MIARKQQILQFQASQNVSRETMDKLERFEALLLKWNHSINLVSRNTIDDVWQRHFLDSAQLWGQRPLNARTWLDIGSGGGFPGLVVAILAAEEDNQIKVVLVESDIRKSAFLIKVSQELGLNTEILTERAEDLVPQRADIISARALAPLVKLLEFSLQHGKGSTVHLFSKGKNAELELTEARKYWTFKLQKTPSISDSTGKILKIEGLGRVKHE